MSRPWTLDEIDAAHHVEWDQFKFKYPDRTFDAWRIKRGRSKPSGVERAFTSDKVVGDFNWREANRLIVQMQELKRGASFSQDEANIVFNTDEPICIVGLSDTHIMSWASDHEIFERVTDEILNTPNLYVGILGDIEQMAIRLRGVLEVSDNMFPPDLQHRYVESWLTEIQHKVLFATWDNHAVQREEDQSGFSGYADIIKRKVIYHSGIGHPTIQVGNQVYTFAVSHKFKLTSQNDPTHGPTQYLLREAHDREIAWAGDSHRPGLKYFTHGPTEKLALNCGSSQLHSGYARRYFSLKTHPIFPCVELDPHEHLFTGFWSVQHWLRATGRRAA